MQTPPPDCLSTRARLEAWAGEALAEPERRDLAAHLAGCPACRTLAAEVEPTALFLEARGGSLPASFWTPFDAGLAARLAAESRRPTAARLAGRVLDALAEARAGMADAFRPAVWLAPAAAMVVLVTLAVLRPVPPQIAQAPRVGGIPSPYAPPHARVEAPAGAVAPGAAQPGPDAPGADAAGLRSAGDRLPEPPALEEVASPSARVYRFDAAGQDATPIYFVVDESIEF